MAARDIKAGSAYVELMLKSKKFRDGLAAAGKRLVSFAKGAAIAGTAAAAAAAGGVAYAIRQYIKMGDTLDKMSQRTGLGVEALSELDHAAQQSGASLSDVERSTRRMQKTLLDAQRGLQSSRDAFENLGLSVDRLASQSPEEQFQTIADALASVEDASLRAGLAQNVFGRSGTMLVPMVENMADLRQEARDLGMTMSGDAASGAARLLDAFSIVGRQIRVMTFEVGAAAAPFIERLLPTIQQYAVNAIEWIRQSGDYITAKLEETVNFTVSAWAAIYEATKGTFGAIFEIVVAAWGGVANETGSAMTWMQETIVGGLGMVTAVFQNWRLVIETAMISSQLSVIRWANVVGYYLGTVVPAWVMWFGDNWRNIFTDVANFTGTVATNIWKNMQSLWEALVGLFSGEGFDFRFTPLTRGFESAIKELPQIAEREMGAVESELQDRLNNLANNLVTNVQTAQQEFVSKANAFKAGDLSLGGFNAGEGPGAPDLANAEGLGIGLDLKQNRKDVVGAFSAAALQAGAGGGGKVEQKQLNELQGLRRGVDRLRRDVKMAGALGP